MSMSETRKIELLLDDLDFDCIQKEFAHRQGQRRMLPDGESNLPGAMVAEIVRDLIEYRDLWRARHGDTQAEDATDF